MYYFQSPAGFSLITNPWMVMPFEALESFTTTLFVAISISYAGTLSSPSTVASLQGLLFGTYQGIGMWDSLYFSNKYENGIYLLLSIFSFTIFFFFFCSNSK